MPVGETVGRADGKLLNNATTSDAKLSGSLSLQNLFHGLFVDTRWKGPSAAGAPPLVGAPEDLQVPIFACTHSKCNAGNRIIAKHTRALVWKDGSNDAL
jgi:hypothetical protein